MKTLTAQELKEINGGNALGGNISLTSNTNSLLSLTFESTYGNRKEQTTISVGNDINLNLLLGGRS